MHQHTQIEEWRDIPGWEGLYEASSLGRIRSRPREVRCGPGGTRKTVSRVRVQQVREDGYVVIRLFDGPRRAWKTVHGLVAESFLGPRPEGMEVCHDNGARADNRIQNLRYGTASENTFDTVKHGTHRNAKKSTCIRGHALAGWNCKPSSLKRGQRQCRSCSMAHSHVGTYPHKKPMLDEIADQNFRKLKEQYG